MKFGVKLKIARFVDEKFDWIIIIFVCGVIAAAAALQYRQSERNIRAQAREFQNQEFRDIIGCDPPKTGRERRYAEAVAGARLTQLGRELKQAEKLRDYSLTPAERATGPIPGNRTPNDQELAFSRAKTRYQAALRVITAELPGFKVPD